MCLIVYIYVYIRQLANINMNKLETKYNAFV